MGSRIPLFIWILLMPDKNVISVCSETGYRLEDVELLEIAAHLFLKELQKIKPIPPIHCRIIITNSINAASNDEPLNGDMEEIKDVDNGKEISYYRCRLADYANSAETMRTLAHELVHVWQAANGSLIIHPDNQWEWQGKLYGISPYNGTDDDLLLPWEVEADTLDLKLVKRFYNMYFSNGK